MKDRFRRFYLNRKEDVSGNSGTGRVAEGCVFSNGVAVLCWQTPTTSTAVYRSVDDVEYLHGHDGATELVWIDEGKAKKPMDWLKSDEEE